MFIFVNYRLVILNTKQTPAVCLTPQIRRSVALFWAFWCKEVFFLKEHLDLGFLEPSDGGEAVDGVACEAADALGDDQVDLARQCIGYHRPEPLAVCGAGAADALVGVDAGEVPLGLVLDQVRVVVYLGLVGGILVLPVGRDAGIACDPSVGGKDALLI